MYNVLYTFSLLGDIFTIKPKFWNNENVVFWYVSFHTTPLKLVLTANQIEMV